MANDGVANDGVVKAWHVRGRRWARGIVAAVGRRAVVVAGLVAVVGAVGSVGLGVDMAASQRDTVDTAMDRRSALVAEAVTAETRRYVDTLGAVAAAVGAFNELTATKFAQVAAPLSQMQLAGATSLVFLVPATDTEIAATQDLWRSRGADGLLLNRYMPADDHAFTIFSEPVDGSQPTAVGIDAAQSPAAMQALVEARRSGRVAISDAYQLLRDRDVPAERRQQSFVLTAPVFSPADAAGTRTFRGWLLMGLRGDDFITAVLNSAAQDVVDVRLRAADATGTIIDVAALAADNDKRRTLHRRVDIPVAQHRWQLSVDAAASAMPGAHRGPAVATVGGLLLTTVVTVLVFVLASARARAEAAVAAAVADLQANERILQQQKADLTAFAGVVAHDLKSPLTGIIGHTETIRDMLTEPAEIAAGTAPRSGTATKAPVVRMLDRVAASADRMNRLIDDLLAYATARDTTTITTEPVDLRSLADEVVIEHLDNADANNRPIPTVYIGDLPTVHGDPSMLRQLLHNLVGNAIKYAAPGQTPRVDITAGTDTTATVTADACGRGAVRIDVADRGIGIPAGQHEAIFGSFHRAHPDSRTPGTGLGLAICHRIVQRHHGSISAHDNPGGGTRFTVVLPTPTPTTAANR